MSFATKPTTISVSRSDGGLRPAACDDVVGAGMSSTNGVSVVLGMITEGNGAAKDLEVDAKRVDRPHGSRFALFTAPLLVSLALFALALAPTSAAAATETPEINEISIRGSLATRVELAVLMRRSNPETILRVEYSTSQAGPWELAAETAAGNGADAILIRHLKPATLYYVRAIAENDLGKSEVTNEFTTTPIDPPVIDQFEPVQNGNTYSSEVGVKYANLSAQVLANGAESTYHFEYGTSPAEVEKGEGTSLASVPSSPVSAAEEIATSEVQLKGLAPETTYYLRVVAENEKGATSKIISFTTITGKPRVSPCVICEDEPTNITDTSVTLHDSVNPDESETHWRIEYALSESGPWIVGPEGVIPASEADEKFHQLAIGLTGLAPSTVYYLRFSTENEFGVGVSLGGAASAPYVSSLETAGAPYASVFSTHTFAPDASEALRVFSSITADSSALNEVQTVTVDGSPTGGTFTIGFEGNTTTPIGWDAPAAATEGPGSVEAALSGILPGGSGVQVTGPRGGPYRVEFTGEMGGKDLPQLTADASGLTPSATVSVTAVQNGGSRGTQYHLEYIEQGKFEKEGWAGAVSTPVVDGGAGGTAIETEEPIRGPGARPRGLIFGSELVASDLPVLASGKTYRYRFVVANQFGAATSSGQTLTTPATPAVASESCPNEALRAGPSALLPDCRAYEQVTPANKEGASEITHYGSDFLSPKMVGEDGNHFLMVDKDVKFGADPDSGEGGFLFSRGAESGWQMTSVSPQPTAGVNEDAVRLESPDLTSVALEVGWETVPNKSADVTLEAGPTGGPYATVASMPRAQVPDESEGGRDFSAWVAASADFSKLVFWTEDRKLLAKHSTTLSGADLYEYSGGQVRQVNIDSEGRTIGTCGAQMVDGFEDNGTKSSFIPALSSPNAVSAEGRRVFFEAVPGSECNSPKHLYMRFDGGGEDAETRDLGEYRFLGASSAGSELLLEHESGGQHQVVLYNVEARTTKALFSTDNELSHQTYLSADFNVLYFSSEDRLLPEAPAATEHLYRYDIPEERLQLALPGGAHIEFGGKGEGVSVSPDGRFFYFASAGMPGVPGGGERSSQVYRYDSVEGIVQCISCVSPFDPEPKLDSTYFDSFEDRTGMAVNRMPNAIFASANGDYVFFDTLDALIPSDIDGEIEPEGVTGEHSSALFSLSSDVYEWRKDGVDGCVSATGCLSLISSGQGGTKVMLLGTDQSGRDVFFTSTSQLVPQDDDSATDIYNARIGGGEPPPAPRPVECEGDACSTPLSAPVDVTPSSFAFSGAGNQTASSPAVGGSDVSRKGAKCAKGETRVRGKCVKVKRKTRQPKHKSKRGRKSAAKVKRIPARRRGAKQQ
jgi:hypothetical protein